jgi:hypothetical protein
VGLGTKFWDGSRPFWSPTEWDILLGRKEFIFSHIKTGEARGMEMSRLVQAGKGKKTGSKQGGKVYQICH